MTVKSRDFLLNSVYNEFLIKKDTIKDQNDLGLSKNNSDNWENLFNSQIYFNNRDYSKSKENALKILENSTNESNLLVAEAYNILGRIARLYKLDEDANAFYNSSINNFKKERSFYGDFGVIRLEFNQANILLLASELSKASKAYDELLNKINTLIADNELQNELDKLKLKLNQNKALTLLYQAKVPESKEFFEKALSYISSVSGTSTEADLYLNYSNLTIVQEDFKLTYSLLSKAGQLYKNLDRNDLFSKIEIDKIKINLIEEIDQAIDPLFASNLISLYDQAKKGKDVNLRIVEIFELIYSKGRFDEANELKDYLLQHDFLPDLRGRILFVSMNLLLQENKYEEVFSMGKEILDITKVLKDEESILPINILLTKAKYMLKKNSTELLNSLKSYTSQLLKLKDVTSAITVYEEYFPILFDQDKFTVIIEILEQVEGLVLKKFKDENVKEYHEHDLILIFALTKQEKAKKLYSSRKQSFEQIKEVSRFKTILSQNNQIETEIKEFLQVA